MLILKHNNLFIFSLVFQFAKIRKIFEYTNNMHYFHQFHLTFVVKSCNNLGIFPILLLIINEIKNKNIPEDTQ